MSKVRLCFAKEGVASYISHLDLLRTFQRVFIRAGMVIRHSAGFHPHPMMSFVLPLSVGQTSVCELLDFETEEEIDCAALPARLAPCLPLGWSAMCRSGLCGSSSICRRWCPWSTTAACRRGWRRRSAACF